MGKYLYVLAFFCIGVVKGQNLQDLKNEKSIFVIYDIADENVKKRSSTIAGGKIDSDTYYYTFKNQSKKDNCDPEQFDFWITYSSYDSFNDFYNKRKTPRFEISQKFLEMNKSKIINKDFMDSIGYEKTFSLLRNIESLYIIEKKESNNNVFVVKKASFGFSPEE